MPSPSFEEIRLPFIPDVPGGTSAAGAGASFHNDNSPRLRTLFLNAVRLAGRVAFLKARSVAQSGRTVATTFNPYSFLVCQRIPRAVTVVASAYPLPVHVGHLRPRAAPASDHHQTRSRASDVQNLFAGFANDHR